MIARRSLGYRLIGGAVLWIAIALVAADLVLTEIFERHVEAQFDDRLQAELIALAGVVRIGPDGAVHLDRAPDMANYRTPYSGHYWQVSDVTGESLAGSRSLWDGALHLPSQAPPDGIVRRDVLRGPDGASVVLLERTVVAPGSQSRLRLAVAANRSLLDEPQERFEHTLLVSLAVLGIGLAFAAALQVGLGLRPLGRLRERLAAVRDGREERLAGDFPSEIEPLVAELNAVLDRNAEVVARARTQTSNLAHALKTPLAVLANETGDLEARDPERAQRLRRQTNLMLRQIDYHLARARAAGATRVPGLRTPLEPQVGALIRTLGLVHRERGVELTAEVPDGLVFRGESQDLDEMLGNVMDNACKWAARRVRVAARRDGDMVVVTVEDDGPGLPPEARAEVFDRGRRLDESTAGTGLGLSIVRDLAELYGGSVTLGEASLGGLRVELRLPGEAA